MLRLAMVGKGGAGKSTIAGVLARALARRGEPVLAIDSDPMPGLSVALGLGTPAAGIPDDAIVENDVEEGERQTYRLRMAFDDAIDAYTLRTPEGVRYLQFGKLRGHIRELIRSQTAFRLLLDALPDDQWHVIGDLPGGTRQPFFGWAHYARTIAVVVEPTTKSMMSARRLLRLAGTDIAPERFIAIVNKARPGDGEAVAARLGLDLLAEVPADAALVDADRAGVSPIDHCPGSAGVHAIESIIEALVPGVPSNQQVRTS